ncbi:MAG: helix-turn-helix transcriptional regulator [Clostridia bacterium]|nr:helix-turn-helix transcriptional regulator [Clostridia bacterium]
MKKTITNTLLGRICNLMGEQNLTQYRLAEKSGLPFSTIKSIMQRKTNNISLKTIILLAKGLEIHPSKLIEGDEFMADNLDLE